MDSGGGPWEFFHGTNSGKLTELLESDLSSKRTKRLHKTNMNNISITLFKYRLVTYIIHREQSPELFVQIIYKFQNQERNRQTESFG